MDCYLALFENDLFSNKHEINKLRQDIDYSDDIDNSDDTDFSLGMSTWSLGITTNNPGLQLLGLNELWDNNRSLTKRNKVTLKKIHLADGIKIKEKYSNFPLSQSVFARLINLAFEDPSLSPAERLNKVLEEEKIRRLTGRHM